LVWGDKVTIRATEHFLQQAVEFFKEYCAVANEEYAAEIERDHAKELADRKARMALKIKDDETRLRILQKLVL
jgi:hypothetical protein